MIGHQQQQGDRNIPIIIRVLTCVPHHGVLVDIPVPQLGTGLKDFIRLQLKYAAATVWSILQRSLGQCAL